MSASIERLVQAFRQLPGVGKKTATKYVYSLLAGGGDNIQGLQAALKDVAEHTVRCGTCFNWTDDNPCRYCDQRSTKQICVVEHPGDVLAMEKGGYFRGQYHVLGGLLDPIQGVTIESLTVDALISRIESQDVQEVILALSPTREGQATGSLIATMLVNNEVKLTRLAYGVPLGGQLEFLDEGTLGLAMEHRRDFHDQATY